MSVMEPRLTISVSVLATLGSGTYGLLLQVRSGQNLFQAVTGSPGVSDGVDLRTCATLGGRPRVSRGAVSEKAGGTVSYLLRTARAWRMA